MCLAKALNGTVVSVILSAVESLAGNNKIIGFSSSDLCIGVWGPNSLSLSVLCYIIDELVDYDVKCF